MAEHRCISGARRTFGKSKCLTCQRAEAWRWQKRAEEYEKQLVEIATFIGKDASHESGNSIAEVAIAEIELLREQIDALSSDNIHPELEKENANRSPATQETSRPTEGHATAGKPRGPNKGFSGPDW